MMVLMHAEATAEQIEAVIGRITANQMQALRLPGDEHVAIGIACVAEEGSLRMLPSRV
jgi:hypothetical protein